MNDDPVLQIKNLLKHFPIPRGPLAALRQQPARHVHAVDDISFEVHPGEIVALVGESGCGKTTTAKLLMGLEQPSGGTIHFRGQDVAALDLKQMRRQIQMVFQDPYESLNPRMTVFEIVAEPLEVHGLARRREEKIERVQRALEAAGLKPAESYLNRLPHELSGGQRQRVVIAGALVLEPQVLVADEPVSMLDMSIRAEILNLLWDLRELRGISIVFITHDLGTAAYFTDRIAVMYLGRIVEIGPTREVLKNPQHPYTRALLSVVPVPNPRLRRERIILQGETPNPIDLPSGCRFHPRCPVAIDKCKEIDPPYVEVTSGHQAACLLSRLPKVLSQTYN